MPFTLAVQPFEVTKLTDLIDERVLEFIHAGFSHKKNLPWTILERREGGFARIPSKEEDTQPWTKFCRLLRSDGRDQFYSAKPLVKPVLADGPHHRLSPDRLGQVTVEGSKSTEPFERRPIGRRQGLHVSLGQPLIFRCESDGAGQRNVYFYLRFY